ncbi:MAG: hypothetical protein PUF61_14170 [Spirochaetales bacterium]|nr:hypothetical protein [Spirochaetales bacterium]
MFGEKRRFLHAQKPADLFSQQQKETAHVAQKPAACENGSITNQLQKNIKKAP